MTTFQPSPKPLRLFFFWAGIIATFAYRVIIVLNFYSPLWVQISWYVGTVGFILYFWHRAHVQKKHADLVRSMNLVDAVNASDCISADQRDALRYLLQTIQTSKARWNSLFIFWLSIVALVIGLLFDFFGIG